MLGRLRRVADALGRGEWLTIAAAGGLIVVGLICVASAAGWHLTAWSNQQAWLHSADASRAQRALAAPTPIWVAGPQATPGASGSTAVSDAEPPQVSTTAGPDTVELVDASFVFFDPPERGAKARFLVNLRTRAPDIALVLSIPGEWFADYSIASTTPDAHADVGETDGARRLTFEPRPAGDLTLVIDVISRGDSVLPPLAEVSLASGEPIGTAHPRTIAPMPRPGPISAVRIPSLNLKSAVVPITWEPPAFVVGELKNSANVGQGNAVLVGHLTGAAGAVFARLNQLHPGDTIVATSRGLDYTFVVSDLETLPSDDSVPAVVDSRPRLTIMTCTGTWDPVSRNYSDRLWVTAEPPLQAAATIAANATRPARPTPTPRSVTAAPADSAATDPPPLSSAGLGAERTALDRRWGPPIGETSGKLVVYRKDNVEYHVGFTADPPRAQLIEVQPLARGATFTQTMAVQVARAEFPDDAAPRTEAPEAADNVIVERLTSHGLAATITDTPRGGDPGDVLALYARGPSGAVERIVVAAGDDVLATLSDAAR